ncbi:MAG: tRNA pseudouridine(13) synthase TruD, partial [Deltaproteobacteria bacterium]|nr:tRNA pseudouridine(13) synthase TruD [Deltaproteobacteria bacterium]
GKYSVFLLRKAGWNTDDIIRKISRENGLNLSQISYGGKKDRHSVSEQFITVRGEHTGLLIKSNYCELKFLGYSDEPMTPVHILTNSFSITVRYINPESEERLVSRIDSVSSGGFLNYFDEQRFRSFDESFGFVAEKILKRHYSGALKIIITSLRDEDDSKERRRKRFISEHWGEWERCLENARGAFEKMVFNRLLRKKNDFLNILRSVDKSELSMYFSVYQSYFFNEVLSRLVRRLSERNLELNSRIGVFVFPEKISAENSEYLKNLIIPLISGRMMCDDRIISELYEQVMREREIRLPMFNLRKIRKAYFKSVPRRAVVFPEKLNFSFEPDEIYKGKKKLIINFDLPPGSYATMLLKQIFTL